MALQREKNKKEMEQAAEALEKANKDLEALKNSEASNREIEKAKAKVRTLKGEKTKARNKYFKSVDAEKNKTSIEQEIAVLEDLDKEDLAEVGRVGAREALTAVKKRKEALGFRKEQEMRALAYENDPERRLAKKNFLSSTKVINK